MKVAHSVSRNSPLSHPSPPPTFTTLPLVVGSPTNTLEGRVRLSTAAFCFSDGKLDISWCQSYVPTKGSSRKIHPECVTFFQNERVKTEITCAALSKGIWWESNLTVFFLAVECYSWSKNCGFMKTLIHFLLIYVLSSKKEALGSNALWLLKGNILGIFSIFI